MKCPECNVQQLQGLTKPLKEGYLLKHKKRVFGRDWKENWFVLYEDSTMAWYKNKEKQEMPLGTLVLKDAPEMVAVGQFTFKIPGAPPLPLGTNYYQLLALGSKTKEEVHWLLASSEDELNDWMNAISKTLPMAPSKQLKPETIKFKNGKIMFYNQEGMNIGTLCASMKPVFKKCKNCCTSCDYSTNYYLKDREDVVPLKCGQEQNNASTKTTKQLVCECGTGFLMGHAMASTINGWRGWGEGLGWQIAGLCHADFSSATNGDYKAMHNVFSDEYTNYLTSSHDLGDVDYEPGAHTTNAVSAFSHEVSTVLDSTSESTGFMSFDFLL